MSQAGPLNSVKDNPQILTQITTDSGIAIPSLNNINLFGGTDISTAASGSTVTITFTGASGVVTSVTGTANQILAAPTTGAVILSLIGPYSPSSYTPYAPVVGGTTSTGALQSASTGMATSGFVLTSTGSGSIPTWQKNSSILTIDGDIGSVTGSTITIYANTAALNSGSSVNFTGSGTTLLFSVSDVNDNTIIGNLSGNASISGDSNTSLGVSNFILLTTGQNNTAIGFQALSGDTSGTDNVALGALVLQGITTGSNNTGLGSFAGVNYTTGSESNNLVIANRGTASESNVIRIGTQGSSSQQQNKCFIAGITGVTVSSQTIVTLNSSTGQLGEVTLVPVANGGTGASTLTGVLIGNGTSAVTGNAVTNHDVLVGGASNAITSITNGTTGQILTANTGANPGWSTLATGVSSVTGTALEIDVSPTTGAVVVSIDTGYLGQTSITTLGTISTGTWNGTVISGAFGGTGVANTGLTITLSSGATGKVLASDSSGNGTWQALSGLSVTSITGTANQIAASASTGAVTLSLTNGISIGSYQGTASPSGGIIAPGQLGIGTTAPTAVTEIFASGTYTNTSTSSTNALQVSTGHTTSTDYTMYMGVDKTQHVGYIQASQYNSVVATMFLQPRGGQIIIGSLTPVTTTTVTIESAASNILTLGGTQTAVASNTQFGMILDAEMNPTSGASVGCFGIYADIEFVAPTATTIAAASAIYISNIMNSNVGTITKSYGIFVDAGTGGAGTITTSYGGYFTVPTSGSTNVALYTDNAAIGNITPYAVVCGGTSSTSPLQNVSGLGTSGFVLTSNGASALPTWQAGSGNVSGPVSSTDTALVRWNGTTGKVIENSGVLLDNSQNMTGGLTISLSGTVTGTNVAPPRALSITNNLQVTSGTAIAAALYISPQTTAGGGTMSNAMGIFISAGSPTTPATSIGYGLYVQTPVFTTTHYCAYLQANVGINQTLPICTLETTNSGFYNNAESAPTNGFMTTTGHTSADWALYMGGDATTSLSYIQSANYGVAVSTLTLNARGGSVTVGTPTVSNSSALTVSSTGAYNTVLVGTQVTQSGNLQVGLTISSIFSPTANLTNNAISIYNIPSFIAATSTTMAGATGMYVGMNYASNIGTITNGYGLLIDVGTALGGGSTLTNSYGAFIKTPSAGTNKLALYADNACFGTTTISNAASLTVSGANAANTVFNGVQQANALNFQYGAIVVSTFNPSGGLSGDARAISSQGSFIAPTATTIANATGIYISNGISSNVGTITTVYGLHIDTGTAGAGTVSTAYGAFISTPGHGTTTAALFASNISTGGTVFPTVNKGANLGGAGGRFNVNFSASTTAGTSRLALSKTQCDNCKKTMMRGTGTVYVLGEIADYISVFCTDCGASKTEAISHLPSSRLSERKEPECIIFEGFHIIPHSGNSRGIQVKFNYGQDPKKQGIPHFKKNSTYHNSTYLSDAEYEDMLKMTQEELKPYLMSLGLREWYAMEEVRIMEDECAKTQAQLDKLVSSMKNVDLLAK